MNDPLTTLYDDWRAVALIHLMLFLVNIALAVTAAKYSAPSVADERVETQMKDKAIDELRAELEQATKEKEELIVEVKEMLAQKNEEIEELRKLHRAQNDFNFFEAIFHLTKK